MNQRRCIADESFIPRYVHGQQLVLGITLLLPPPDFPAHTNRHWICPRSLDSQI